jgi:YteA family regulatory protein
LDPSRREYFAGRLRRLREELTAQLRALEGGLDQSQREALQELSGYDNHPADLGTEVFERSKDLALRELARRRLEAVEEALKSLETGGYGYCRSCGRPVEEERLEALPETTLCLDCRRAFEARRGHRRRPVEEEVVAPPYGGLYGPGREPGERAAYDGEDAWQDAARHGTSESISDLPGTSEYPRVYADYDEDRGAVEQVDSLPYYRDRRDGALYQDYSGKPDCRPPRRL